MKIATLGITSKYVKAPYSGPELNNRSGWGAGVEDGCLFNQTVNMSEGSFTVRFHRCKPGGFALGGPNYYIEVEQIEANSGTSLPTLLSSFRADNDDQFWFAEVGDAEGHWTVMSATTIADGGTGIYNGGDAMNIAWTAVDAHGNAIREIQLTVAAS